MFKVKFSNSISIIIEEERGGFVITLIMLYVIYIILNAIYYSIQNKGGSNKGWFANQRRLEPQEAFEEISRVRNQGSMELRYPTSG